jgi:hypothetical protein
MVGSSFKNQKDFERGDRQLQSQLQTDRHSYSCSYSYSDRATKFYDRRSVRKKSS